MINTERKILSVPFKLWETFRTDRKVKMTVIMLQGAPKNELNPHEKTRAAKHVTILVWAESMIGIETNKCCPLTIKRIQMHKPKQIALMHEPFKRSAITLR